MNQDRSDMSLEAKLVVLGTQGVFGLTRLPVRPSRAIWVTMSNVKCQPRRGQDFPRRKVCVPDPLPASVHKANLAGEQIR